MRIEGIEPGMEAIEIANRFARGEIDRTTMHAEIEAACEIRL